MQRSSTKIGALATALAKAQSELANPEKTLVATLPAPIAGGVGQSFRYASLASGLELVRKCLASMRSQRFRQPVSIVNTGLIRLTTKLVHASGEWMSSDWPVCSVAETASPHRMGAALTYARALRPVHTRRNCRRGRSPTHRISPRLVLPTRAAGLHERGDGLGGLRSPPRRPPASSGPLRLSQGRTPAGRQETCIASRPSPPLPCGISCSLSLWSSTELPLCRHGPTKALPRQEPAHQH